MLGKMVYGLLSNVKNQTILLTLKNISHPEPEYVILQFLKAGVLNVLKIGEGIFETALISFIVFFLYSLMVGIWFRFIVFVSLS